MVDVVAHRGDSWSAIENTVPAFASAIARGVDVVELDARVSADGVPVVLHDGTLSRLWGVPARISDLTAAQIGAIRSAGVGIPTLAEALDVFTGTRVRIMVDLPTADGIERIIEVVRAHPVAGQIIWSGTRAALVAVRAAHAEAVIYTHRPDPELSPTMINMDGSELVLGDIETAHHNGWGMSVWTVDDPAAMRALIDAGADSITTNRPDLALRVRAEGDRQSIDDDLARYRDVAVALGQMAIRAQRSTTDFTVDTKKDEADLVTDVDRGIERTVREVLAAEFPDHAVVGEEFGGEPGAGPTWYCDPVDGTTNFANGLPWSSFSLCLVRDDRIVVGVVADPWREEVYEAVAGAGARLNGVPIHVREQRLVGAVVLTELAGTTPWPGMNEFVDRLAQRSATARVMGSGTLTMAQVAAGRCAAGTVHRFSPIDHGAPVLIAAEAGAEVLGEGARPVVLRVSRMRGRRVFTAAPGLASELADCLATPQTLNAQ